MRQTVTRKTAARETGNTGFTLQPHGLWRRAKHAGCGRLRSLNICFSHGPIPVYLGRQHNYAIAAKEEQLGRFTAEQRLISAALLENLQCNPRGDIPSTNLRRWTCVRGHADVCFNSCYAACACDMIPRYGPPMDQPGAEVMHKKRKMADVQRSRVHIAGFI